MTNKIIISILCMAALIPASAQVAKEITVEREVVPTLRDVSPLSFVPTYTLPAVEKPALSYSERTVTARIPTLFSLLEPTAVADSIPASPWRGYAAIGYFPSFNLGASAGYRLVSSRSTTLDAWLQYDGSSYKIAPAQLIESLGRSSNSQSSSDKVENQSGAFGLRFSHTGAGGAHLGINVDYALDHFNNPRAFRPVGSPLNQTVHRFGINGLFDSKTNDLRYSIGLNYKFFAPARGYHQLNIIRPLRENHATISGALFASLSENSSYRLDVEAELISWWRGGIAESPYGNSWINTLIPDDGKTSGLITLTPSYRYGLSNFSMNLGIRLDMSVNDDTFLHVAPDVKVAWTPSDFFALFVRAGGGEHINTQGSLFAIDRYSAPVFRYDFSHIPVEGEVGLRVGPFRGASFSLGAAYAVANQWLMPYSVYEGTVMFQPHDMRGWQFKAGIDYNIRNIATISVAGTLNPQDKDDMEKGYYTDRDRAKYTLDAGLTVHPLSQLDVMLGYELRACRSMSHYWIQTNGIQYYGSNVGYGFGSYINQLAETRTVLPNLANLRAGASWRFTPAFTVFARLENILARKTPSYSMLPGQGFTGLVGVAYKF